MRQVADTGHPYVETKAKISMSFSHGWLRDLGYDGDLVVGSLPMRGDLYSELRSLIDFLHVRLKDSDQSEALRQFLTDHFAYDAITDVGHAILALWATVPPNAMVPVAIEQAIRTYVGVEHLMTKPRWRSGAET